MRKTLEQRFMSKVAATSSGCWEWTACKDGKGYGAINVGGRLKSAHRVSYELFRGSIPVGKHVLHDCDNPICVNPKHLFLGSHADNMADKVSKRRQAFGTTHGRAKLAESEVIAIRASKETLDVAAEKYGVHKSLIGYIRSRKLWRHI